MCVLIGGGVRHKWVFRSNVNQRMKHHFNNEERRRMRGTSVEIHKSFPHEGKPPPRSNAAVLNETSATRGCGVKPEEGGVHRAWLIH